MVYYGFTACSKSGESKHPVLANTNKKLQETNAKYRNWDLGF